MSPESLYNIVVCPETHQSLAPATRDQLDALNKRIADSDLHNQSGAVVEEPLEGALIREDQQVLYPIRHGLPVLLIDEAISLTQPLRG